MIRFIALPIRRILSESLRLTQEGGDYETALRLIELDVDRLRDSRERPPTIGFDCGEESIDTWLQRYARHAEAANSARTF